MNEDVFNVDSGVGQMWPQEDVHHALEGHWGPMEAEGKDPVLLVAAGSGEGGFRLGLLRQRDLPVAFGEV